MMILLLFLLLLNSIQRADDDPEKYLAIDFLADAQIETGSQFIGAEFHHSSPCPQRISFFYPVANSIDLSTDYWHRDTTFIMNAILRHGTNLEELHKKSFRCRLTPYSALFYHNSFSRSVSISYRFSNTKPAMVVTFVVTNTSGKKQPFELYVYLPQILRTSHTYSIIRPDQNRFDQLHNTFYSIYDTVLTQNSATFLSSAEELPKSYLLNGIWHNKSPAEAASDTIYLKNYKPETAGLYYKKELSPGGKMTVVLLIGSSHISEATEIVRYLSNNYPKDVRDYEASVKNYITQNGGFRTGDNEIDKTEMWAKGVLAVNRHYIDGVVAPMPCPAEYNFYFTHDVLMTDLAAVNFDLPRVKEDLRFILKYSGRDSIIPHAYYWKDTLYKVEYATEDNWNHFWFIILSASYLRHSGDVELLRQLSPLLMKSRREAFRNYRNGIMWAYRPDWWDIGKRFGPRSYMSILAYRALRDYSYILSILYENDNEAADNIKLAEMIRSSLNEKLWSARQSYLTNYFEDGTQDEHYYMGSLLAGHYGLLDSVRLNSMIETASDKLLDKKLGIYTVLPMDFHKLIDFWKFSGNEAGEPFFYANGGIWQHANSWYLLALAEAGMKKNACSFLKNTMTLSGIMNSPNGFPAMYEYRNGNIFKPDLYGKIDKPQFMWFAGWYVYCLYHLFAIDESSFSISFTPYLGTMKKVSFPLNVKGKLCNVEVSGKGDNIQLIKTDGHKLATAVLPDNFTPHKIQIVMGHSVEIPYLASSEFGLLSALYEDNILELQLKGFANMKNSAIIISKVIPEKILLEGRAIQDGFKTYRSGNGYLTKIEFVPDNNRTKLQIDFNK